MMELLASQLLSLRAQVGAIQLQADALQQTVDAMMQQTPVAGDAGGGCQHPEDRRVPNANNLGEPPAFYCQACKQIVQE